MKKFAANLLIAVLFCLSLAGAAAAREKNLRKTITLADDVLVNDRVIKKGTYQIKFDAASKEVALLQDGVVIITAKATVKHGEKKAWYNSASFATTPKGRVLTALTFEGDKRTVVLAEANNEVAEGQSLNK